MDCGNMNKVLTSYTKEIFLYLLNNDFLYKSWCQWQIYNHNKLKQLQNVIGELCHFTSTLVLFFLYAI